jgi:TolB protein
LRKLTSDGLLKQRPVWSPVKPQVCYARHEGAKILLWLLDTQTGERRRITDRELPEYDASWSPDGKQLVFCCISQSGTQGNVDLCTVTLDKPEVKHLIGDSGGLSHEESPAWSPDGKQIAFTSTRDGNQEIYVVDASGQNLRRITQDPGLDAHPTWTPDGQHLLFATNRWGDFEIAQVDTKGQKVERLTNSNGLDDYPVCSPDGKTIAFLTNRTGQYEVFTMTRTGTDLRNVSDDPGVDNFPAWTPQGDLSWVSDRDGGFEIYLLSAKALAR